MNELLENTMKAIKYNDKEVYSKLIKREIPNYLRDLPFIKGNNDLEVKSGIGMGNDALVPWVAIVDRNITKNDKVKKGSEKPTVKKGYYCVYLFSADGSSVYLSFNQGVTQIDVIRKKMKIDGKVLPLKKALLYYAHLLREEMLEKDCYIQGEINLHTQVKSKSKAIAGYKYQFANIAAIKYDTGFVVPELNLRNDLEKMIEQYILMTKKIPNHEKFILGKDLVVREMWRQEKALQQVQMPDDIPEDVEILSPVNTFKNEEEIKQSTGKKKSRTISDAKLDENLKHMKQIGDKAEQIVLKEFKKQVEQKFGLEYGNKVRQVSKGEEKGEGHGLGYDILAYDFQEEGEMPKEIFVEVKGTTSSNIKSPFDISINELRKIIELKEKYRLVRVLDVNGEPKILIYKNFGKYESVESLLSGYFNATPTSYRITGVKVD
ncbi:DUF3578 domain-containing protein [Bacillus tropicus]|uniref:MrcB family domain-containing protein n=1 Tax=Bacillus tropicus TaxID=2026188 RepID=UPI0021D11C3A|nr:DUF3578 domain-containing protein [Bacillus tropicus]MCU5002933.1 DUF3578 domain-containing protein [Bacillus tropicus]